MSNVSRLDIPDSTVTAPRLLLSLHGVVAAVAAVAVVAVALFDVVEVVETVLGPMKMGRASTELVRGSSTKGIDPRALRIHA